MILQNDVEKSIVETDTTFTYYYLEQLKTNIYLNFMVNSYRDMKYIITRRYTA